MSEMIVTVTDSSWVEDQWHLGLSRPLMWAFAASPLAHAAQTLWTQCNAATEMLAADDFKNKSSSQISKLTMDTTLYGATFMLAGYAMENVLKGLSVEVLERERQIVKNDSRLIPLLQTHKLVELAATAQLPLNLSQLKLLEMLETEVMWGGRYQRPKKPNDFFPKVPGKANQRKIRGFSKADWEAFVSLYNELYLRLDPKTKAEGRQRP